jgi:tetratricopeptide (TPR) repeat protein
MGKKKGAGKSSLLDGDCLSHKLQVALEHAFARFDADADGALSRAELQAFATTCNDGVGFEDEELEDIQKFFETNESGGLTLKGFLQMYYTQTVARPSDTWKDLSALGFSAKLELVNAPVDCRQTPTSAAASAPVQTNAAKGGGAALCEQSDQLYTEGKHNEALRAALTALSLDRNSAAAHRCAGRAFFALGKKDAAERSWKLANELSGASTDVPPTQPSAVITSENVTEQPVQSCETSSQNTTQDAHSRLATLEEGTPSWAHAVLDIYSAFSADETSKDATAKRPSWMDTPESFEALAARTTEALPESADAWGMRGDAALGLPMGASIAAEFYEKAASFAPPQPGGGSNKWESKKDAALARFFGNLDTVNASLANMSVAS